VTGAAYSDDLLDIQLVREVLEHKKPRNIQIDGASSSDGQPQAIEAVNDRQAA
jgi:molecular chaperone IbpA